MNPTLNIGPMQAKVLAFIRERGRAGAPPKVTEIAKQFGQSFNWARRHLQLLKSKGQLEDFSFYDQRLNLELLRSKQLSARPKE